MYKMYDEIIIIKIQRWWRKIYDYSCTICYDSYKTDKNYNCSHLMCKKCFFKWNNISNSCPICRRSSSSFSSNISASESELLHQYNIRYGLTPQPYIASYISSNSTNIHIFEELDLFNEYIETHENTNDVIPWTPGQRIVM